VHRQYVEFGFNTNRQCEGSGSNTCELWQRGWTGLLLDGIHSNQSINLHREFLTSRSIVPTLRRHGVRPDVDYISIDIDSADLWLFRAILRSEYRPALVSVEYNCNIRWPQPLTYPDPAETRQAVRPRQLMARPRCYTGASAAALDAVAREYNYTTVAVAQPLDLFFLRSDLAARHSASLREALGEASFSHPLPKGILQAVPLNQHGDQAATAEEASELLDYTTWSRLTSKGFGRARAESEARRAARPRIAAVARLARRPFCGSMLCGDACFRNIRPSDFET